MMSDERYFKIEYYGEWYLFDSTTISEQLVKEQAEYGYGVFANSLSPSEICEKLNEQEATIKYLTIEKHQADKRFQTIIAELKKENEQLRKENERQNNEIKLLRKKIIELMDDLEKIPPSIREVWLE